LRMGEDRRRDHPEPDAEELLARDLVAALDAAVDALVGGRQLAAAVLLRTGDPPESRVVALGPPLLRLFEVELLLLAVGLLEQPDVVVALAPDERLVLRHLELGVGVEEGRDLFGELVERHVRHGSPWT